MASNLGVVELTAALHYVFDSPKDKLIFDVGHQVYAHKMLTGRMQAMDTLRTDEASVDLAVQRKANTTFSLQAIALQAFLLR